MADYGFRISQDGFDVKTATETQLALTSKSNSYKIPTTLQGKGTISIPASSRGTVIINHGLGYHPSHLSFYEDENSVWHSMAQTITLGVATDLTNAADFVNTGSLNQVLINNSVSSTRVGTIYYIIFLEST